MSVPVALDRLSQEIEAFGPAAYLLTVDDGGRPHVVAVVPAWEGSRLAMRAGRRTLAHARQRPGVTLLWPPAQPGGYSLIVDGEALAGGDGSGVMVAPTGAVLHRPAAVSEPGTTGAATGGAGGCTADCIPLDGRAGGSAAT